MIVTTVSFSEQNRLFILEDFLPFELALNILNWFLNRNAEKQFWQESQSFSHYQGRLVYQGQHSLLNQVLEFGNSQQISTDLGNLINGNLRLTGVDAWIDLPGYKIRAHHDSMDSNFQFFGLQIYFTQQLNLFQGTYFYQGKQPVINLPLRQNLAYFLDRGDRVLHGLPHPVPENSERYSLHLKYQKV